MRRKKVKNRKGYVLPAALFFLLAAAALSAIGGEGRQNAPVPADIVILDRSGALGADIGAAAALQNFAALTARKADPDGIPGTGDELAHRIAVAGADPNGFQDMCTEEGKNSIAALGAPAAGQTMADVNDAFVDNPLPAGETRYRVVVVLSDGLPAAGSDAAAEIAAARETKDTHGAAVYAVGLFAGADPASAGAENGGDIERQNWFLQNLSSNDGDPPAEDGGPSYYLSAGDGAALEEIFQNIAANLDAGTAPAADAPATVNFTRVAPFLRFPAPDNIDAPALGLQSLSGGPEFMRKAGGTGATAGLQLDKWVAANDDGTYTVNLEAYATGTVMPGLKKPIDFVLVIDQSSSMKEEMPAFLPAYSTTGTVILDKEMMYFMRAMSAEELTYKGVVHLTAATSGVSADGWYVVDPDTGQPSEKITPRSDENDDTDPSHVQLYTYFKKADDPQTPPGDPPPTYFILDLNPATPKKGYLPVVYLDATNASQLTGNPLAAAGWYVIDPQSNTVVPGGPYTPKTLSNTSGTQFFENTMDTRLAVMKRVLDIFTAVIGLKTIGEDGVPGPYAYAGYLRPYAPAYDMQDHPLDHNELYYIRGGTGDGYQAVGYHTENVGGWTKPTGWYVDSGGVDERQYPLRYPGDTGLNLPAGTKPTQFYDESEQVYYIKDAAGQYQTVRYYTANPNLGGSGDPGWYADNGASVDPRYVKYEPMTSADDTAAGHTQFYTEPAYNNLPDNLLDLTKTYYAEVPTTTSPAGYRTVRYYAANPNLGENGGPGWYADLGANHAPRYEGPYEPKASATSAAGAGTTQFYAYDEVPHRVAMVGFGHDNSELPIGAGGGKLHYCNTELFIGEKQYNYGVDNEYNRSTEGGTFAPTQYGNAFQDMSAPEGRANVKASIGCVEANGGTATHLGMEMAKGILDAYDPIPHDNPPAGGRMVVLFTDGIPGKFGWQQDFATQAIGHANVIKSMPATVVYDVGIFPGADSTSAGDQNGSGDPPKGNWFMHCVSSNWSGTAADGHANIEPFPPRAGYPEDTSYYLSAGNELSLMTIFAGIVAQIQFAASNTAQSGVKLDKTTFVSDGVTDYFDLPADAGAIAVKTSARKRDSSTGLLYWDVPEDLRKKVYGDTSTPLDHGKTYYILDEDGAYQAVAYYTESGGGWTKPTGWYADNGAGVDPRYVKYEPMTSADDTAAGHTQFYGCEQVNPRIADGRVRVDGFDFERNFVSALGRKEKHPDRNGDFFGRKLMISFTIKPKAGFLGGNQVPTNKDDSGVYKPPPAPGENPVPVKNFPVPMVNMPIPEIIEVTAQDKNVYLKGGLTNDALKTGATAVVRAGTETVALDLAADYYDLDEGDRWKIAFVKVTPAFTITDKALPTQTISNLNDLTNDARYTVKVTVAPREANGYETAYATSPNGLDQNSTYYILDEDGYQAVAYYTESVGGWTKPTGWYAGAGATPQYVKYEPKTSANDHSRKQFYQQVAGVVAQNKTSDPANVINVFNPALTFRDSEVWYGGAAPANPDGYNNGNYVATVTKWTHKNDDSSVTASTDEGVAMTGMKPTLTLAYTPAADKIKDGQIASKADIPVQVTVKIGTDDVTNETTFAHEPCSVSGCTWIADPDPTTKGDPAFLLHPQTCELTIAKTGGKAGETYVFNIQKDNADYMKVTVPVGAGAATGSVTIKELPVGQYTVTEDTNWSWHYDVTVTYPSGGNSVTLPASDTDPSAEITCANTAKTDCWLNAYGRAVNTYKKTTGGGGA